MTVTHNRPGPRPGWKKDPSPRWATEPKTAAERVFRAFGGPRRVAAALGLSHAAVYRWNYEKDRRGSGGAVPTEWHAPLLEAALTRGIRLERADLVNA